MIETTKQAVANGDPIKAFCWKQPFASLMLPPYNKIETRTKKAHYRGLVLIVATMAPYGDGSIEFLCGPVLKDWISRNVKGHDGFINGCAIGIGRLVDCRKLRKDDKHFLEWFDGMEERYAHIYEDVCPIQPIPMKGFQGWRNVTDEIRNQIKFL